MAAFGGGGGGGGGFGASRPLFGNAAPPQGGGLFGNAAPSTGFGAPASTGFGAPATSGFGAPATGGFGAPAGNPSGGGLFGAPATQSGMMGGSLFGGGATNQGTSLFGAPSAQPAFGAPANSGGGLFGATSTVGAATGFGGSTTGSLFGGGANPAGAGASNAFGATANRPLFGAPVSTAGGFGASTAAPGGGLFGAAPSASGTMSTSFFGSGAPGASAGFGSAPSTGGFGAAPLGGAPAAATKGTSSVRYQVTNEYDPGSGTQLRFQVITMMPAYRDKSFEELRFEDYQIGNKTGNMAAGTLGGTPGFGQPAQSTGFGASGFGATQPSSAPFGSTTPATGGLFGTANTASGFLGASNTAPASGGLFGASAGTTGFGLGASANQTGTGLFGSAPGGGGMFGSGATNAPGFGANTGAGFGASTFGATGPTGPGLFGNTAGAGGGGGLFGSSATPAAGFGAFGTPQPAAGGGGLFGSTAPATSGGLFGQQNKPPTSLFGGTSTQPNTGFGTTPGLGGGPSLFGGGTTGLGASQPGQSSFSFGGPGGGATGGFGFGAAPPGSGPGQTTSLFGTTGNGMTGAGLFGGSSGGLFGQKPPETGAGGGLFSSANTGGGLGSTFGAPGSTGLFGGSSLATPGQGGFNFGNQNKPGGGFGTTPGLGGTFGTGGLGTGAGAGLNLNTTNLGGGGFGFGTSGGTGLFGTQQGGVTNTGGMYGGGAPGLGGLGTNPTNAGLGANWGGIGGNAGTGLFGSAGAGQGLGGASFGGALGASQGLYQPMQQQQQQPLQATLSSNPYGSNPLFNITNPAPSIQTTQPSGAGNAGLTTPAPGASSDAFDSKFSAAPLYRRLPRSAARVRPRTNARLWEDGFLRGSTVNGSALSSWFEVATPAPSSFSSRQFTAPSAIKSAAPFGDLSFDSVSASAVRQTPATSRVNRLVFPKDNVKTLVINAEKPVNGHTASLRKPESTPFTVMNGGVPASEPSADKAVSTTREYKESTFSAAKAAQSPAKSNGSVAKENAISIEDDGSDVPIVKPTPRRLHGQFIPLPEVVNSTMDKSSSAKKGSATKVYTSYREFYNDQVFPVDDESRIEELTDNETQKVGQNGNSVSNMAPTLTRSKYYSIPPMASLRSMSDKELSSVQNFTVGRKGVGEITWIGETDVRGLDLDSAVFLEPREVIVYPNEENKPHEGKGLNKPALVRLEKVWKLDKERGKPVTDSKLLATYIKKLKSHCEKEGLVFIRYEATTGLWEFEAPHFSRYGFQDDDDDIEDKAVEMVDQDGGAEPKPQTPPEKLTTSNRRVVDRSSVTKKFKSSSRYGPPSSCSEASTESSDEEEQTMAIPNQSPYVRDDEISGAMFVGTPGILNNLEASRLQAMRAAMFFDNVGPKPPISDDSENWLFADRPGQEFRLKQTPSKRRVQVEGRPDIEVDACKSQILSEKATAANDQEPLMFACAVVSGLDEALISKAEVSEDFVLKDAGLRMGRSFRIGFGPNGLICKIVPPYSSTANKSDAVFMGGMNRGMGRFRFSLVSPRLVRGRDAYERELGIHAELWISSSLSGQFSQAMSAKRSTALQPALTSLFRVGPTHANEALLRFADLGASRPFSGSEYFELVFRLLYAIYYFDEVNPASDLVSSASHRSQRASQRVSEWFEKYACVFHDREGSNRFDPMSVLDAVFLMITQGKLQQAVSFAIQKNRLRLALLISQGMISGEAGFESDLEQYAEVLSKELNSSGSPGAVSELSDSEMNRLKDIVYLLAGQVDKVSSVARISWLRVVACEFWFGVGRRKAELESGASFSNCEQLCASFASYAKLWPERKDVAAPLPLYHQSQDGGVLDIVYYLFELYSGLETNELGPIESLLALPCWGDRKNLFDFRLQWHVFQLLVAISGTSRKLDRTCDIFDMFASQLEIAGFPAWSIYVRASGPEGIERDTQLRYAVTRLYPYLVKDFLYIGDKKVSADEFLADVVQIPAAWLYRAKALHCAYKLDYAGQAEALFQFAVSAGFGDEESLPALSESHQVLTERVAPLLISLMGRLEVNPRTGLPGVSKQWGQAAKKIIGMLDYIKREEEARQGCIPYWKTLGYVLLNWFKFVDPAPVYDMQRRDIWLLHDVAGKLYDTKNHLVSIAPESSDMLHEAMCTLLADTIVILQRKFLVDYRDAVLAPDSKKADDADATKETSESDSGLQEALQLCVSDLEYLSHLTSSSIRLRLVGEYECEEVLGVAATRRWLL